MEGFVDHEHRSGVMAQILETSANEDVSAVLTALGPGLRSSLIARCITVAVLDTLTASRNHVVLQQIISTSPERIALEEATAFIQNMNGAG
jgi:hypothetical protein